MSGSSPGAVWQGEEMAEAYLAERQVLMPMLEIQEDLLRRLLVRQPHPVRRFLDVGSGDGAISELVLGVEPLAEPVLVDFSEPMLARAEGRMKRASSAPWQMIRGDLSDPGWRSGLPVGRDGVTPGPFSAAVSAFAIHHLPAERKRALFAELFELLEPGAMFVNMDYVAVAGPLAGLFDEQMVANAVEAEHRHKGGRTDEQVERELPDDGDEDRPDRVEDQVQWLRDAGFEGAEVHFKWAEAAVFGAVKPTRGDD
jgi:tRNA (cmo5U34)-methyltransferase